jgi:hypothetical protein
LSRRSRAIDTALAKWPPVAPTNAMRSREQPRVEQALPGPQRGPAQRLERVVDRHAAPSCTKTPGSPLLPELSQTM